MNRKLILGAMAALVTGGAVYLMLPDGGGPTSGTETVTPQGAAMVQVTMPETLSKAARTGQQAFAAACAECHGKNAAGNAGNGPPLVHKIYEPSHHGDMAFHLAVQNGVRAHHWNFGDMPAQDGLTKADVEGIIAYIRELQRANGIN